MGRTMDINALQDFQRVATHGGFGRASRASGRAKATLSRRVADLEDALGVRLIERSARSFELTEAGRLLLTRLAGPLHEVADAVAAARDGVATPRGRLRVAAPVLFSQTAFGRLAAGFVARYPEVQVEAVADDRLVDLVDEHFDVAIRVNPGEDSQLVGRCFARDRLVVAATPSIRMPKHADAPVEIAAVTGPNYRDGDVWPLASGLNLVPRPVLRLSSFMMVRDAIVAGAGVALVPQSIVGRLLERGDLKTWGVVGDPVELWVLHTSRRLQSPKVRSFVEFVCEQFPNRTFVVDG